GREASVSLLALLTVLHVEILLAWLSRVLPFDYYRMRSTPRRSRHCRAADARWLFCFQALRVLDSFPKASVGPLPSKTFEGLARQSRAAPSRARVNRTRGESQTRTTKMYLSQLRRIGLLGKAADLKT